jgi:WD40 repeat protein
MAAFSERGTHATFLPDGKRVISRPREGKLEIWEARTGKVLAKFECSSPEASLLGITTDGKLALTGSCENKEEGLRLVEIETQKPLGLLDRRYGCQAIFTPDGKKVYVSFSTTEEEFRYGVWEVPSGRLVRYAKRADNILYPLAFSPDGKLALSEREEDKERPAEKQLVLWDVASGKEVRQLGRKGAREQSTMPQTYEYVNCATFSADGNRVMAVLGDMTLRCWEVGTGAEVSSVTADDEIGTCAFSPDRKRVVTAAGRNTPGVEKVRIRIWDATGGHFLKALAGPPLSLPVGTDPSK